MLRGFCATVAALVAGCAPLAQQPDPAALRELAPTGKLRFGVVEAPQGSTFFVIRGAGGQPQGVTVDLAEDFGRRLGVPVEFTVAPNSGELTEALAAGRIDAAFMPVDAERLKRLDFGPVYALGRNTYMVK